MLVKIIAVGKIKDRNLLAKCEDYSRRISHDAKLEIVEIRDSNTETEGDKLLGHIKEEKRFVFALGEEGKQYNSRQFAQRIESSGRRAVFLIGGPEGLSDSAKKGAGEVLSLSSMTLTHELARMFLLEQIYRAISIMHNRKYHRD